MLVLVLLHLDLHRQMPAKWTKINIFKNMKKKKSLFLLATTFLTFVLHFDRNNYPILWMPFRRQLNHREPIEPIPRQRLIVQWLGNFHFVGLSKFHDEEHRLLDHTWKVQKENRVIHLRGRFFCLGKSYIPSRTIIRDILDAYSAAWRTESSIWNGTKCRYLCDSR